MASNSCNNVSTNDVDCGNDDSKYFPCEILMIIFEQLDVDSLYKCMFVSRKWSAIARRIAEKNKSWEDIVRNHVIHKGSHIRLHSKKLDWQEVFERSMMWRYCDKAEIVLSRTYLVDNIKKVNVYKDNLIIVNTSSVKYFDIATSLTRKEIQTTCIDFDENDDIVIKVVQSRGLFKKLHMFGKVEPSNFNLDRANEIVVDGVMHYRLDLNKCYVIDSRNILTLYMWRDSDWELKFVSRYFGAGDATSALHVYGGQPYVLLRWGPLLWANSAAMGFQKKFSVAMPQSEKELTVYAKMFQKYGIIFGVNGDKKFRFDRLEYSNNIVTVMECPNLSCVKCHGDVLLVGYSDGRIEFYLPQESKTSEVLKRSLRIRELSDNNTDSVVVSINVQDDRCQQNVFIATHSEVFHVVMTHPNAQDYLYSELPVGLPKPD